jgi:hypothetical protein
MQPTLDDWTNQGLELDFSGRPARVGSMKEDFYGGVNAPQGDFADGYKGDA